jgi:hypothetical protein
LRYHPFGGGCSGYKLTLHSQVYGARKIFHSHIYQRHILHHLQVYSAKGNIYAASFTYNGIQVGVYGSVIQSVQNGSHGLAAGSYNFIGHVLQFARVRPAKNTFAPAAAKALVIAAFTEPPPPYITAFLF